MSQPPKSPSKWRQTIRRAVPPALTVLASVSILSGAVWIHNRQTLATPAASSLGAGTALGSSDGNDTLTKVPTGQHPVNHTPGSTQSQAPGNTSNSNNNPSTQPPVQATPTPTPTGDIGFAPVSGGTVQTLSDSPLSGGSQPSCVVTQYGSAPQTSFGDRGLVTPTGNDLPLPTGMSSHTLLAVSLPQGVLWAQIPTTTMDGSGMPASSSSPTPLYYTPFSSSPTSTLATGVIKLGELPVSLSANVSASSTAWYHPVLNHTALQGSDNLATAPSSSNSTTGTSPAPKNTLTNQAQNTTSNNPAPPTGNRLFLQGFYETAVGAVIAVSVNDVTGANDTWLYLWNENDKTLKPITQLQNSHDAFSWFAVGQDVVYWENRHVLPPKYANYQGEQSVMNLRTLAITRIHLGTWSSQAAAFGNTLEFQVGRSVQWQEFTPSPSIAPTN